MNKFEKKAVLVEAEQWLGTEEQSDRLSVEGVIILIPSREGSTLVSTLGGNLECNLNDYIVVDADGHRSVVKADEFESLYELVEDVVDGVNVVDLPVVKKGKKVATDDATD